MNKEIFLEKYRNVKKPKIQVYFNEKEFLQNDNIVIEEDAIKIDVLKSFYVARYTKNGEMDDRSIEDKITDTSTSLVRIETAMLAPSYWRLSMENRATPSNEELWPIPVATSTCNKTMILDSNHTILSVIKTSGSNVNIPIIRISGTNMESVIEDFIILNRQVG